MATEFATSAYQLNADTHSMLGNIGKEQSIFDGAYELVTKGVPATLIAAGNDISNIPATVGNFFMGDNTYKVTTNRETIQAIDSDLTKYYDAHEMGVDVAGFVAGQFVPGLGATKVVRGGQAMLRTAVGEGKFGLGFAQSLGLQAPQREKYLALAIKEINDTGNIHKLTDTNMLRAFAAGAGQEALEGAAWTAAVNATMHNSPILDQRDASDLMSDVVTGAWMGGAIGGALSGIGATWRVSKAAMGAQKEVHPWTTAGLGGDFSQATHLSPSDKLIKMKGQLEAIPAIPPEYEFAKLAGTTADRTRKSLESEIRRLSGDLAGGDQTVGALTARMVNHNSLEQNLANLSEASHIARVTTKTKVDSVLSKLYKRAADLTDLSVADDLAKYRVTYMGTRAMTVLDDAPARTAMNLADFGDIKVSRNTVMAGKQSYKINAALDFAKIDDHLQAEAAYVLAESSKAIDKTKVTHIPENDLATMYKAVKEGNANVVIGAREIVSVEDLANVVKDRQRDIAATLSKNGKSMDEVAGIVNADRKVLALEEEGMAGWNLRQLVRERDSQLTGGDANYLPKHVKILTTRGGATDAVDGHLLEGMAIIEQKEKLFSDKAGRITAAALGEEFHSAAGLRSKPIGNTAGPSLFGAESGAYGSWSSFFAYVGQRVSNVTRQRQAALTEQLNPLLQKLANNTEAAIEWSVLNERLRNSVQGYKLLDDNSALVLKKGEKIIDTVPIKDGAVKELARLHIAANGARRSHIGQVHVNNGYPSKIDPSEFYPVPRDPKDTPHFAFVIDDSVKGRGHSKMLYAKDAETLEKMRNDVMSDPELTGRGLTVLTKKESEQYYESIGKFEYERTLSENYINNALSRKGKSASFMPLTDPVRIVENTLNWHMQRETQFVRTMVEHRYSREFDLLRKQAEPALQAATSRMGYVSPQAFAEMTVNNPAADIIKMALNVSKSGDYPWWSAINRAMDTGFSRLYGKISAAVSSSTSSQHLVEVNKALRAAGVEDQINSGALYEALNGKVARGKLAEVVSKANGLLSLLSLRTDPFNAMNNTIGHAILLGPETNYLVKNIIGQNADAVAELSALGNVKVPGTGDSVLSPAKLIGNRIKMFGSDPEGREWFRKHGFLPEAVEQQRQIMDDVAHSLSSGDATRLDRTVSKLKSAGAAAEKYSGNKVAEEFNRYVAAGVMKDITDIAVRRGLVSEGEQLAMINTFVNRTQGNYLASQRPGIFQGPLGQAIGLFQTYQFNLLQQAFRYIGEGDKKTAMLMMGLQGGIYGMNGLPAFNAINTHIVGEAPGNIKHSTMYDATMSLAGKEAGEWLLYGALSNGLSIFHPDLKTNIYNRGDINPRHLTLVPTDPAQVPIVQATGKLLANAKESFGKVAMGADVWSTFLRGVEQNGVSRPLAGLALFLEGMGSEDGNVTSMSQQGRITAVHDLWSMQSLMRVGGAKPLDEAIVNDQLYRVNSWRAKDIEKRKLLGEGIKNTISGGEVPSQNQLDTFAYQYAKTGGKQDEYAGWMAGLYRQVNVSKAEELRTKLKAPGNQSMQYIMSGAEGEWQ